MTEEMKERLEFDEYIQVQVGPILIGMPIGAAYALGIQLDQSLLSRYDLVPGVPTPDAPEPRPYLKLREEKSG